MSLNMEPIPIPPEAAASRPSFRALRVGPPPGISDEECGTVESLVGVIDGYPAYADYWRPTSEQLEVLAAGGFIELIQYTPRMVMHSMTVWPATSERAAGYTRACRTCGCTDERACPGGCSWVAPDLCSACALPTPRATP